MNRIKINYFLLQLIAIFGSFLCYSQDEAFRVMNKTGPESSGNDQINSNTNLNEGTVSTVIPIYNYQGRELNLPISLNNISTGVRVDQIASFVGLGWNLNVGGRITRIVRGTPDGFTSNNSNAVPCGEVEDHWWDRDFYKVNALSFEDICQFIYPVVAKSLKNPRVDIQGGFDGEYDWIITAEDGTMFYFGENGARETLVSSSESSDPNCPTIETTSTNSWLLTKIISANKMDEYTFSYENFEWSNNVPNDGEGYYTSLDTEEVMHGYYKMNQQMITEIKHNGDKIIGFVYSGRDDLKFVGSPNRGNALSEILFYRYKEPLKPFKKAVFSYSYFSTLNPTTIFDRRLKLDNVTFHGIDYNDNSTSGDQYSFDYISPETMPSITSFARDYLGLYNAVDTNQNLLPYSGHRDFNLQAALTGTLNKITYPKGGAAIYEYEQNFLKGGYGHVTMPEVITYEPKEVNVALNINIECEYLPARYKDLHPDMDLLTFFNYPNNPFNSSVSVSFLQAKTILMDLTNESASENYFLDTSGTGVYLIQTLAACNVAPISYPECEVIEENPPTEYYSCLEDTRNILYLGNSTTSEPLGRFVAGGLTTSTLSNPQPLSFAPGKYQITLWSVYPLPNTQNIDYPSLRIYKIVNDTIITPSYPSNLDNNQCMTDGFRIKSITTLSDANDNTTIAEKKLYKYNFGYKNDMINNILHLNQGTFYESTQYLSRGYSDGSPLVHYQNAFEVRVAKNGESNGFVKHCYGESNDLESSSATINSIGYYALPILPTQSEHECDGILYNFPFHNSSEPATPISLQYQNYGINQHNLYLKGYYDKNEILTRSEHYSYNYDRFLILEGTDINYNHNYWGNIEFITGIASTEYFYMNGASKIEKKELYSFDSALDYIDQKTTDFDIINYDFQHPILGSKVTGFFSSKGIKDCLYTLHNGNFFGIPVDRYLLSEIKSSLPGQPTQTKAKYEYDDAGNLTSTISFTPGMLTPASYQTSLYGYKNRFIVASISGVTYSDLILSVPGIIAAIKAYSDQPVTVTSYIALQSSLKVLRDWLRHNKPYASIVTSTYNPVYGITSVIDQKEQMTTYEYDVFGRQTITRLFDPVSNSLRIVSENTYNTRP